MGIQPALPKSRFGKKLVGVWGKSAVPPIQDPLERLEADSQDGCPMCFNRRPIRLTRVAGGGIPIESPAILRLEGSNFTYSLMLRTFVYLQVGCNMRAISSLPLTYHRCDKSGANRGIGWASFSFTTNRQPE